MVKTFKLLGLKDGKEVEDTVLINTTNLTGNSAYEDAYDYAYGLFDKAVISVSEI